MFKDGPKHYRTFFLSCVWALGMVLTVLALQVSDQTTAANIAFCIGTAGAVLGLAATLMHYRLSTRERRAG